MNRTFALILGLLLFSFSALAHDLYLTLEKNQRICGKQPFSTNKSGPVAAGALWDLNKVESALKAEGLRVRRDVTVNQPFLSLAGRVFVVRDGDAEIQTYIYANLQQRAADTDKLDPKSATPPTMRAAWLMPPSVIANRNLAAIVLTRNEALRRKITAALNK